MELHIDGTVAATNTALALLVANLTALYVALRTKQAVDVVHANTNSALTVLTAHRDALAATQATMAELAAREAATRAPGP